MLLTGRHKLADFASDADFAARHALARARRDARAQGGEVGGVAWSDLYRGSGHACVAGVVNGHHFLRVYAVESSVSYASRKIDEEHSDVSTDGRVDSCRGIRQILVDSPETDTERRSETVEKARGFLALALRGWTVCWIGQGTTCPVAVIHRPAQSGGSWGFVHVQTYYPDRMHAIVDLGISTADLKAFAETLPRERPSF